jgi:hypothetical protein
MRKYYPHFTTIAGKAPNRTRRENRVKRFSRWIKGEWSALYYFTINRAVCT